MKKRYISSYVVSLLLFFTKANLSEEAPVDFTAIDPVASTQAYAQLISANQAPTNYSHIQGREASFDILQSDVDLDSRMGVAASAILQNEASAQERNSLEKQLALQKRDQILDQDEEMHEFQADLTHLSLLKKICDQAKIDQCLAINLDLESRYACLAQCSIQQARRQTDLTSTDVLSLENPISLYTYHPDGTSYESQISIVDLPYEDQRQQAVLDYINMHNQAQDKYQEKRKNLTDKANNLYSALQTEYQAQINNTTDPVQLKLQYEQKKQKLDQEFGKKYEDLEAQKWQEELSLRVFVRQQLKSIDYQERLTNHYHTKISMKEWLIIKDLPKDVIMSAINAIDEEKKDIANRGVLLTISQVVIGNTYNFQTMDQQLANCAKQLDCDTNCVQKCADRQTTKYGKGDCLYYCNCFLSVNEKQQLSQIMNKIFEMQSNKTTNTSTTPTTSTTVQPNVTAKPNTTQTTPAVSPNKIQNKPFAKGLLALQSVAESVDQSSNAGAQQLFDSSVSNQYTSQQDNVALQKQEQEENAKNFYIWSCLAIIIFGIVGATFTSKYQVGAIYLKKNQKKRGIQRDDENNLYQRLLE